MSELPRGIAGRSLAVAIGAALLGVVYLAIIAPLLSLYDSRAEQLEERTAVIERLVRAARDLPRLHAAAEQWQSASDQEDLLAPQQSDAVAAAELQSTVKGLVASGGANLNSAEILPPLSRDAFRRIGLHVSFSGSSDLLVTVLRGIETAHPQLFVDNLEIRSTSGSTGRDNGDGLIIGLDVYGFRAL